MNEPGLAMARARILTFASPPRMVRAMVIGLAVVLGSIALPALWSVNLFPVITEDSLTYLEYADNLGDSGFVVAGYRQFGYPLFLAIGEQLGRLLTIEPLLFTVAVQRALLVLGLVYAIWVFRWWSIPILGFALTGAMIAYTNLMLTEGLSIPLALILGTATAHFFRLRFSPRGESPRLLPVVLLVVVGLTAFGLLTIRFPYAVFGVCPLVVAVAARDTTVSRPAWAVFGSYALLAIVTLGLTSFENQREFAQLSPSTNGARTEYWAAWKLVFEHHPENAIDPSLSQFYDQGDPYAFIHGVDAMDLPYQEEASIYEEAMSDLLAGAGIGEWSSRFESFAWALRGGRIDDIEGTIEAILNSDRMKVDQAIHMNSYSRENGAQALADRFNRGALPEAVITAPLGLRMPLPAARVLAAILLPVSLAAHIWGLAHRYTRLLGLAGLSAVIAYAGLIGYIRADNFRFMTTIIVFAVTIATGVIALRAADRSARSQRGDPLAV
jgi:hypothetical protein